jgi:hypothetical protein
MIVTFLKFLIPVMGSHSVYSLQAPTEPNYNTTSHGEVKQTFRFSQ